MGMFHYYDLNDTEAFVFDDYLISQMHEGECLDHDHTVILREIIKIHFENKSLVYISNRVKSYTVDPLVYKEVEKMKNLLAIIIVTNNQTFFKEAKEELKYFNKPSLVCNNLTDAIIWASKLVEDSKKEKANGNV